jgi:HD-GYP domain-containing protein (c-di-GMP phosphodiesterase class II)
MQRQAGPDVEQVRAAEIIAALSLATDLGTGVPVEHGLQSTLVAMRLCAELGVDAETASQTYFACLLFYIGCTANADVAAEVFPTDDALNRYAQPTRFGSPIEMAGGMLRALAPPTGSPLVRLAQIARGAPLMARRFPMVIRAICEVAHMLSERLGLPPAVSSLFPYIGERWDGHGKPNGIRGAEIPLPVRIVHVARDAAFQGMLHGDDGAGDLIRQRATRGAFDPEIAMSLARAAPAILALDPARSAWDDTLAFEPQPHLMLAGEQIDLALHTIGDFSDLTSPFLLAHSSGVAGLAATTAQGLRLEPAERIALHRAALVHDIGRVAVPARIWQNPGALTADDWEHVRLHAYHSERVLTRSPFLAPLAPVAGFHHERLDGSGYHRGTGAPGLSAPARLLAAVDAFHAMTEPRAHRPPLSREQAGEILSDEGRAGRLDPDAVTAVLGAVDVPAPRMERPAGLTAREAEVVVLLARGMLTKQIARALSISTKTADRHIQNAYRKMGVSTRASAALFAMQHGLVTWGELPIPAATAHP